MIEKKFTGTLSNDDHVLEISFSVCINDVGKVEITLNGFGLDASTEFISESFYKTESRFEKFLLKGTSGDGANFECDNLIFTSLGSDFGFSGGYLEPVVEYSVVKMNLVAENFAEKPKVVYGLRNFHAFNILSEENRIGLVEMRGAKDKIASDALTGCISVQSISMPQDLREWRAEVDLFCRHLQKVMSFAGNADISCPVVHFFCSDVHEIEIYARHRCQSGIRPPFNFLNLQPIFHAASKSFFDPPFLVNKLSFAIDWFNMQNAYEEANLITCMTVLESLVDSNLSDHEKTLLGDRDFDRLRRKLSCVVKSEVESLAKNEEERRRFVVDINERFVELKRKSLLDKLKCLSLKWGVVLDDIGVDKIQAAKKARDQVVHRGHYAPKSGAYHDLYEHHLLIREIVVRFILAAIGFQGQYQSYINGCHTRNFIRI